MSSERMRQRLREIHSRAAIRKWELRQAGHASGVWSRVELLLAGARRTLAISEEEVSILRAAGFAAHPIGAELQPPKALFVISETMLPPTIEGREVESHDAQEILRVAALILIPFG